MQQWITKELFVLKHEIIIFRDHQGKARNLLLLGGGLLLRALLGRGLFGGCGLLGHGLLGALGLLSGGLLWALGLGSLLGGGLLDSSSLWLGRSLLLGRLWLLSGGLLGSLGLLGDAE